MQPEHNLFHTRKKREASKIKLLLSWRLELFSHAHKARALPTKLSTQQREKF